MPIKDQLYSFRIKNGARYTCWEDVLVEDNRGEARKSVLALRAKGVRAFSEHHPDGYSRVFIHEQDGISAGIVSRR